VPDFGLWQGVVKSDPSIGGNATLEGARIAIDSEFMYVISGVYRAAPIDTEWRVEKRHLSDVLIAVNWRQWSRQI